MCAESQQECSGREECGPHDPGKRNHCYVLWKIDNVTKKSIIKLKVNIRRICIVIFFTSFFAVVCFILN